MPKKNKGPDLDMYLEGKRDRYVQIRGVRPFFSEKYDLTQHPNYKLTADYDKRNWFDIEKFLKRQMKLKEDDVFDVVEMD